MKFGDLQKLKNLNVELLETLIQTCSFVEEYTKIHNIPFPTEDRFLFLIEQARHVIQEINEEIILPLNLQHRKRTPLGETVPVPHRNSNNMHAKQS